MRYQQCSEKHVIPSHYSLQTKQRFDPFLIHEVETLVIYCAILLSCHSCLYDFSALNAWIDKHIFDTLLFLVCNSLSSFFHAQGCTKIQRTSLYPKMFFRATVGSQYLINNQMYKYIDLLKAPMLSSSPVLVWIRYTSFFIFIALPFLSVNPSAFPEEVKSVQRAIKLIEPARYQLRCSHPWQHILQWPCRTLAWCYLSKFNSGPAVSDLAAPSFFLSGSDWNTHSYTHRPDFHVGESPPLWVRRKHDGLAGLNPSAPIPSSNDSFSLILPLLIAIT